MRRTHARLRACCPDTKRGWVSCDEQPVRPAAVVLGEDLGQRAAGCRQVGVARRSTSLLESATCGAPASAATCDRVESEQAHGGRRHRRGKVVDRDRRRVGGCAASRGDHGAERDRLVWRRPAESPIRPRPGMRRAELAAEWRLTVVARRCERASYVTAPTRRSRPARPGRSRCARPAGEGGVDEPGRRQPPVEIALERGDVDDVAVRPPPPRRRPSRRGHPLGKRPSASSSSAASIDDQNRK